MNELINTPLFTITITVLVYLLSDYIYIKTKCAFLNPVMLSIVILIIGLKFNNIDFKTYDEGTYIIKLLLNASVVALAYPLYLQWNLIKQNYKKILFCMFLGSSIGIISVVLLAILFGASDQVILSLIPKSITTPIAIKVSESIGGIAPLSAAVVIMVGIFGSVVGVNFLKLMKINKPESVGLAMGTAAHGLGTATVAKLGDNYSAMAGLAIALNGLLTAILSPLFVDYILKYIH